ncbi:MAG: hypothetical protein ACLPQS_01060 [Acidimicrobiales bacterium]
MSDPLYALVDSHVALKQAKPDGASALFTDRNRWNTPGLGYPTVQYLFASRDVARERARSHSMKLLGLKPNDLRDDRGPHLLEVTTSIKAGADLHDGVALQSAGIDPGYPDPLACDTEALRPVCRVAGDAALAAYVAAVVRPVEMAVCVKDEVLVDVATVSLSVANRWEWRQWG